MHFGTLSDPCLLALYHKWRLFTSLLLFDTTCIASTGLNSATEDVQKQLQGVHAHQVLLADSLSMEFSALNQKTHEISNSLTTEFSEIANSLAKEFTSLHKQSHKIVDSLTTEFSSLHDKTHEIGAGVGRSVSLLKL